MLSQIPLDAIETRVSAEEASDDWNCAHRIVIQGWRPMTAREIVQDEARRELGAIRASKDAARKELSERKELERLKVKYEG